MESMNIPENYRLLGVSFGGMVAAEFAKIRQPEKLYLVSTISKRRELPFFFELAGSINLYKWLPDRVLTDSNIMVDYLFGVRKKEDKRLLREMLRTTDTVFLRWAMNAILDWQNQNFLSVLW